METINCHREMKSLPTPNSPSSILYHKSSTVSTVISIAFYIVSSENSQTSSFLLVPDYPYHFVLFLLSAQTQIPRRPSSPPFNLKPNGFSPPLVRQFHSHKHRPL